MSIDWTKTTDKVSKYFTVKECLWLPQWNRLANETDGLSAIVKTNLIALCTKMDEIREIFGEPIKVHCCYRPPKYNTLVKGAYKSSHLNGMAIDFSITGWDCDDVRAKIIKLDLLNSLQLRMEDLVNSNWVHIDIRMPIGKRYFKP